MAEAARAGKDFHTANAEAWGKERKTCKNGIFAVNYGAAAKRVSLTLDISVEEAMEIIEVVESNLEIVQLKERFWQSLQKPRSIHPIRHQYNRFNTGVFYDVMGTRHFYPNMLSTEKYKLSSAKRQSFNCLMQGGCFSILAHLLNKLYPAIRHNNAWVGGLVHDEAIIYCPKERSSLLLYRANEVFNGFSLETDKGGIPVKADFHIVNNWSEK
jgi:DNA polymerase I-like protein with 3'-5' exonuclease and polymerase domains